MTAAHLRAVVDTHWRGFISSGRSFSDSTLNSRYAVIGMTKRQPAMPIANIQLRTGAIILNNPRPRTHWGHSTKNSNASIGCAGKPQRVERNGKKELRRLADK